jgi:hypothetical protein
MDVLRQQKEEEKRLSKMNGPDSKQPSDKVMLPAVKESAALDNTGNDKTPKSVK